MNTEIIELQEELKQIAETRDQFLSIMSHDLKNPITGIRGFVELMIQNFDSFSDEKKKIFLHEIFESVERLSLLHTNLLSWARLQSNSIPNRPVSIQLAGRVSSNISLYKLIASNKGIKINNHIPDKTIVLADQDMLDTIIRNIISNSLKFTEKGGLIKFSSRDNGSSVLLEIEDTGAGMDEEKVRKILDSKTDNNTSRRKKEQGSGLGLDIVVNFICLIGGEFSIISHQGKGSKFLIRLPLPEKS